MCICAAGSAVVIRSLNKDRWLKVEHKEKVDVGGFVSIDLPLVKMLVSLPQQLRGGSCFHTNKVWIF